MKVITLTVKLTDEQYDLLAWDIAKGNDTDTPEIAMTHTLMNEITNVIDWSNRTNISSNDVSISSKTETIK